MVKCLRKKIPKAFFGEPDKKLTLSDIIHQHIFHRIQLCLSLSLTLSPLMSPSSLHPLQLYADIHMMVAEPEKVRTSNKYS